MKTVRIVATCAGLLALAASEASARQADYTYVQCDLRMDGRPGSQAYRIGNGQWDFMANPDWEALEWVNCGEQRRRDSMLYVRTCTFSDREFRSDITVRSIQPGMEGFSVAIVHHIDRYSGGMSYEFLTVTGSANRSGQGSCQRIQEPTPAQPLI